MVCLVSLLIDSLTTTCAAKEAKEFCQTLPLMQAAESALICLTSYVGTLVRKHSSATTIDAFLKIADATQSYFERIFITMLALTVVLVPEQLALQIYYRGMAVIFLGLHVKICQFGIKSKSYFCS
jgi:hypothetical protein